MGKIHDRIKAKQATGTSVIVTPKGFAGPYRRSTDHEPVDETPLDHYDTVHAFHKQKYIIVEYPGLGEVALTFPNFLIHKEMAQRVFRGMEVTAAGFFYIGSNAQVTVYGRSDSLNIDSRIAGNDAHLIERTLGLSD